MVGLFRLEGYWPVIIEASEFFAYLILLSLLLPATSASLIQNYGEGGTTSLISRRWPSGSRKNRIASSFVF